MKLSTKFERSREIRGGVIAISVFDLMTLNIALRVAVGSGIIFTKFDLRQRILAWIIEFLMPILYVTLWRWPLTRWPWKFVVHSASRDRSLYEICAKSSHIYPVEFLIILRIFAQIMSHCDLHFWPLDLELLQHFGRHTFKLCTKFKRIIHC